MGVSEVCCWLLCAVVTASAYAPGASHRVLLGRGACPVSSLCALRACAEAGASRRGFVASAALGLGALGLGMPATSGATVMNPGQLEKFQTQLVAAAIAEEGDPVATTFAVHQTEDPARPFVVTAEKEKELLNAMAANDVVFLGEHHNKASDHALQAKIISGIGERRGTGNVAVGLEMVQQQFQSALDKYIGREIAEDAAAERALYDGVEWAERWQWSFEDYLPVFRLAREKSIPLIALNVDSDAMARVRFGGLESLTQAERDLYVQDKKGFIAFSKTPGFIDYVEKIIMPSYSLHARMGLLGKNPSQANFYSSRILWDEGMSTLAYRFLRKTEAAPPEQKQMMVVLEGADHVKFSMGSVGRMKRMAPSLKVASVLLNPTPVDTRLDSAQGDGEAPLAISFAYGGQVVTDRDGVIKERVKGVVGVADYLWFSSPPTLGLLPAGLRSLA